MNETNDNSKGETSEQEKGLIPYFKHVVTDVDYEVTSGMQKLRTKIGTYFWKSWSFVGLPFIWSGVSIVFLILDIFHVSWVITIAGLSHLVVVVPLKMYFNRRRPYHAHSDIKPLTRERNSSFPSGHTYYATITAFALAFCYGGTISILLAAGIGILVATSRIYQGVHYLSDVVVAFFLGMIVASVISFLFPQIMVLHELSIYIDSLF
jgi:membrane-associated phospholipid phosphatase